MNPFALVIGSVRSPTGPGTRCTGSSAVSEKERSDGGLDAGQAVGAPDAAPRRAPTDRVSPLLLLAVATAGIQIHGIFSFDLGISDLFLGAYLLTRFAGYGYHRRLSSLLRRTGRNLRDRDDASTRGRGNRAIWGSTGCSAS